MFHTHKSRSTRKRECRCRKLRPEPLEDRRLLAVITVGTELDVVDANDGLTSLREAIVTANSAPGADEIVFDFGHDGPATIRLEEGELQITDWLSITGDSPDLLTIDAQEQSRIFHITATSGNFALAGLTLTEGDTPGDGGAVLSRGKLIVTDCVISGNYAHGDGGGISGGVVTVVSSTISDNRSHREHGAITGESVTVISSTLSDNGGGVRGSTVTVDSSMVVGNEHRGIDGDMVMVSASTISENVGSGIVGRNVNVTSSTVSGNSDGGISGQDVTVTGSTISRNSGGGIYGDNVTVHSSTISGNSAFIGGGIRATGGVQVAYSTISYNSAVPSKYGGYGAGISAGNGRVRISGSIIAGNTANNGAPDLHASTDSPIVQFSLIGNNSGTDLAEAPTGSPDAGGNLIGGPINGFIDPSLGPLVDNGGPTLTHALMPDSPAMSAGNPTAIAGVGEVPAFDQRARPYTRVDGGRIDIGAYERHDLQVEIVDVASPTLVAIDEVTIEFNSPVTGFDVGDLELWHNGMRIALTGSASLNSNDHQTFVLSGLADGTAASGYYTLKLIDPDSGILDTDGSPLDAGDSMSWAMGRSELGLTVDTLEDEMDLSIDDGDVSLRDAIGAAAPGETIDFDASLDGGTILLTLGELSITRPLTIDAAALPAGVTIDAAGNDPTPEEINGDGSRIFHIDDADDFLDSPVAIRGLTLSGGDVAGGGGAIFARESLTVVSSTVANNAAYEGGGVYAPGTVTVISSTISGNSAEDGGGIFAISDITVTSSTITSNSARTGDGYAGDGGGISAGDGQVKVIGSILAGNRGTNPDLHPRASTHSPVVQYSLIGDQAGADLTEAPVGSPDGNGNLIGGPIYGVIDPLLEPLQGNGGPTLTHRLRRGSAAIDSGNPSAIAGVDNVPEYDQRGEPYGRVKDGDGDTIERIDIGAFEMQYAAVDGDFNNDGFYDCSDIDDLVVQIAASANHGAYDMTGDGLVDLADRNEWLAEAGSRNLGPRRYYRLGDANLDGVVDVSDFNIWNEHKFSPLPVVPGWCQGNFNADGTVEVSDFDVWNDNRFSPAAEPVNVALNADVQLSGGPFFTDGWGGGQVVAAETIVDGVFLPRGRRWDQGAVWWDSNTNSGQHIVLDLGSTFVIDSFIVQADDNDAYVMSYWDLTSESWQVAWDVPNFNQFGAGMQTRPNPADDLERHVLPAPVVTDALRFEGNLDDGDRLFSVSEIQAFGYPERPASSVEGPEVLPVNVVADRIDRDDARPEVKSFVSVNPHRSAVPLSSLTNRADPARWSEMSRYRGRDSQRPGPAEPRRQDDAVLTEVFASMFIS